MESLKSASKSEAFVFLQTLHQELDKRLLSGAAMQEKITNFLELRTGDSRYRHLCSPEHAFTRGVALPEFTRF